jgi:hypothetical protein
MKIHHAIRRRFLELLVAVATVHVVAIGLYYALGLAHRPDRIQRIFAWSWMGVTVAVVMIGLQRLKRARRTVRAGSTASVR